MIRSIFRSGPHEKNGVRAKSFRPNEDRRFRKRLERETLENLRELEPRLQALDHAVMEAEIHLAGIMKISGWRIPIEDHRQVAKGFTPSALSHPSRFPARSLVEAFSSRVSIEQEKINLFEALQEKCSLEIQFLNVNSPIFANARERILFLQKQIVQYGRAIDEHTRLKNHFEVGKEDIRMFHEQQKRVDYFTEEEKDLKEQFKLIKSSQRRQMIGRIRAAKIRQLEELDKLLRLELVLNRTYGILLSNRTNKDDIILLRRGAQLSIRMLRGRNGGASR